MVCSHHSMSDNLNAVCCFHSDLLNRPAHFDDDAEPPVSDSHTPMLRHAANVPNTNVSTVFATNSVNSDGNCAGDDEGGGDGDLNDCCDFANLRLLVEAAAAAVGDGGEVAVVASMYRLPWLAHEPAHHTESRIEFSIEPCNNDKAMNSHTLQLLHDRCSVWFGRMEKREKKK